MSRHKRIRVLRPTLEVTPELRAAVLGLLGKDLPEDTQERIVAENGILSRWAQACLYEDAAREVLVYKEVAEEEALRSKVTAAEEARAQMAVLEQAVQEGELAKQRLAELATSTTDQEEPTLCEAPRSSGAEPPASEPGGGSP